MSNTCNIQNVRPLAILSAKLLVSRRLLVSLTGSEVPRSFSIVEGAQPLHCSRVSYLSKVLINSLFSFTTSSSLVAISQQHSSWESYSPSRKGAGVLPGQAYWRRRCHSFLISATSGSALSCWPLLEKMERYREESLRESFVPSLCTPGSCLPGDPHSESLPHGTECGWGELFWGPHPKMGRSRWRSISQVTALHSAHFLIPPESV